MRISALTVIAGVMGVVHMPTSRIAVQGAVLVGAYGVALVATSVLAMASDGKLRLQHRGDEQQNDNRTHVTNLQYHHRLVNMG